MSLQVQKGMGERPFLVEEGKYSDYEVLKRVLRGHPAGIEKIHVESLSIQIAILRSMQLIPPNTGRMYEPVRVIPQKNADVELTIGQLYRHTSNAVIQLLLRSGGVFIESQGQEFLFTLIDSKSQK